MINATLAEMPQAAELARIPELLAGAQRFLDHDVQRARHYLDRISALFSASTADSAPLLPEQQAAPNPVKGGLAGWQLRKITRHIERHLAQAMTTEELAALVKLSKGHFCRAFKASLGETPHSYIMRLRLRRAQTLMLRTSDPLSQIAIACGMTDQAHLSRLFRRTLGTTPMQWRRHWQDEN